MSGEMFSTYRSRGVDDLSDSPQIDRNQRMLMKTVLGESQVDNVRPSTPPLQALKKTEDTAKISLTPAKADELEDLFSQFTIKTPSLDKTATHTAADNVADSDNDDSQFEDCISSLPNSPKSMPKPITLPTEDIEEDDDDSEVFFNTKLTRPDQENNDTINVVITDKTLKVESTTEEKAEVSNEELAASTESTVQDAELPVKEIPTAAIEPNPILKPFPINTTAEVKAPEPVQELGLAEPEAQLSLSSILAENTVAEALYNAVQDIQNENVCEESFVPEPSSAVGTAAPFGKVDAAGSETQETDQTADDSGFVVVNTPVKSEQDAFTSSVSLADSQLPTKAEPTEAVKPEPVTDSSTPVPAQFTPDTPLPSQVDGMSDTSSPLQPTSETTDKSPAKGSYTAVNEEDVDPFKPCSTIANSPMAVKQEPTMSDVDPFKPTKAMANTPVKDTVEKVDLTITNSPAKTEVGPKELHSVPPVVETADPFQPSKTIPNSPIPPKVGAPVADMDPFKTHSIIPNSPLGSNPVQDNALDPFKPSNTIGNSPTRSVLHMPEKLDTPETESTPVKLEPSEMPCPQPKASQTAIVVPTKQPKPFKPAMGINNSPVKTADNMLDDIDPFKPSKTMANSPLAHHTATEVQDPFKPSKAIANSPAKTADSMMDDKDPFKPCKTIANSPVAHHTAVEDQDPFKPSKAIANSPVKAADNVFDDIDPFKPSKTITNSPIAHQTSEDQDPFKPSKAIANSPAKTADNTMDDKDPFEPCKTIANSPVAHHTAMEVQDPFKPSKAIANSPEKAADNVFDDIDPFKPSKAIANSPVAHQGSIEVEDPSKSSKAIANSPVKGANEIFKDIDPLKLSKAVANSPASNQEKFEDSFKTKNPLSNSPTAPAVPELNEDIDPFKPRKAMTNSPVPSKPVFNEDDIDPFKPKKTIANSPIPPNPTPAAEEIDPFKTKSSVVNSPIVTKELDIENDENKAPEKQPKSAKKKTGTKSAGPRRFKPPSHFTKKGDDDGEIQIFMPSKPAAPVREQQAQDTESQEPKPNETSAESAVTTHESGAVLQQEQRSDDVPNVEEEQFISGSVFNDSASWDLLNSAGCDENVPDIARQSLYVKFDPLIKGQAKGQPLCNQKTTMNETATWEMLNRYGPTEAKTTGRESLFVSFDPLTKKGSPALPRAVARLRPNQVPTEPPQKPDDLMMMTTPPGNTNKAPSTPTKDQQHPTNNLCFSPFAATPSSTVPTAKTETQNITPDAEADDIIQIMKYTEKDLQRILREQELQMQDKLLSQQREYTKQITTVKKEGDEQRTQLSEMMVVVAEYELLIENSVKDSTGLKVDMDEMKAQKEQAEEDLRKMEANFVDMVHRFEKTKGRIETYKKNEEVLKKHTDELNMLRRKQDEKYAKLKEKAEEKIQTLMTELEKFKEEHRIEIARYQAQVKKYELQTKRQEKEVERLTNENKELTAICDDLLSATGGK